MLTESGTPKLSNLNKYADMIFQEKEESAVYWYAMNNHYCHNIACTLYSLCDEKVKLTNRHYKDMYNNLIKGFIDIYVSLKDCDTFSSDSLEYFESRLKDGF